MAAECKLQASSRLSFSSSWFRDSLLLADNVTVEDEATLNFAQVRWEGGSYKFNNLRLNGGDITFQEAKFLTSETYYNPNEGTLFSLHGGCPDSLLATYQT